MQIVRVVGKLEPGGAQLALLRLSRELRERYGVRTRLLAGDATPDGIQLARSHGATVETFHVPGRLHPTQNLQWQCSIPFTQWLGPRLAGADIVHAHMIGAWWAAGQVIDARTPLVATEHNQVNWTPAQLRSLRPTAGRVDRFYAMGPAAARFALEAGVRPEVLRPARSAVDGIGCSDPDTTLMTPRITFAGRFASDKGIDVLVEALALLPSARRGSVYLLGDGPLRGGIAARIARLPGADQVVMPGWVDRPWKFLAGSAVHVVPSREEAWSQSAVLAMGLGVPVVGTRVDGLIDTLTDGRGILVPPEDPSSLASAVAAVLTAEAVTDLAGARQYAHRFTAARVAEDQLRGYQDLIVATSRRGPGVRVPS